MDFILLKFSKSTKAMESFRVEKSTSATANLLFLNLLKPFKCLRAAQMFLINCDTKEEFIRFVMTVTWSNLCWHFTRWFPGFTTENFQIHSLRLCWWKKSKIPNLLSILTPCSFSHSFIIWSWSFGVGQHYFNSLLIALVPSISAT